MSECSCNLPDDHWSAGVWHLRANAFGDVCAYERCPASRPPLEARLVRAGVPEQYRAYTRAGFPGEWPQEATAFVDDPVGNVYIYGSNGTGKTHLATAILGELVARGFECAWCSAKLLPELDPEHNDSDRVQLERYRAATVLVMDDLWSEGAYRATVVRNTAEFRYQRARATVYTSMVSPAEALRIDSDLASRACSGVRIERAGVDNRFRRAG